MATIELNEDKERKEEARKAVQEGKALAENKYGDWTSAVEEYYRRDKGREMPVNMKSTLGYCFRNVEKKVKEQLSKRGVATERLKTSDLGTFIRHGFEVISAVIPNASLTDIMPVQPLERRRGRVFYLDYVMENAKGPVSAGDTSLDAKTGANLYKYYSAQRVDQETIEQTNINNGDSVYRYNGSTDFTDITKGTFVVEDSGGNIKIEDDNDNGDLTGDVDGSGSANNTIDYATGDYDFDVAQSTAVSDNEDLEGRYKFSFEDNRDNVTRVKLDITSSDVEPEERELLADWLLQSAFELEQHYGKDAEELLLNLLAGQVRAEIDIWGVEEIKDNAVASTHEQFDQDDIAYTSLNERNEDFKNWIIAYRDEIEANSGRFTGNVAIAGREVMNLVEGLNDFQPEGDLTAEDITGPHKRGEWMGIEWFKSKTYPDKDAVLGFNPGDDEFLRAPGVFLPFIPVMTTPAYFSQNAEMERGVLSSNGIHFNNKNGYLEFSIA